MVLKSLKHEYTVLKALERLYQLNRPGTRFTDLEEDFKSGNLTRTLQSLMKKGYIERSTLNPQRPGRPTVLYQITTKGLNAIKMYEKFFELAKKLGIHHS